LTFIEAELNRLIGESTAARDMLARLDGTSFAVHVEGLGLTVVLHAHGERLRVDSAATGASATLRATPFDLLRLMNAEGVSGVKRTHAEEEVAKWVGDVPAHALGDVVRGAGSWLARAAGALRMNTAEYLQEESRAMPAPLEAQAFYGDVARLRDAVERAAARLARLERGR
jgi:ubiquinone biosynthesis protein UbiJ